VLLRKSGVQRSAIPALYAFQHDPSVVRGERERIGYCDLRQPFKDYVVPDAMT
jgi:hypothetical protein